jgi:transposase-like protein
MNPQQQYERSGIYSPTCPDCNMKYVGQTGSSFRKRYNEHFHDFKYNTRKSSFATHLLDNNHSMGPIGEVMDVLHTTRKGKYMDTVEKFYIYKETWKNNQINDKNTVKPNAIFEVLLGPHNTKGGNID